MSTDINTNFMADEVSCLPLLLLTMLFNLALVLLVSYAAAIEVDSDVIKRGERANEHADSLIKGIKEKLKSRRFDPLSLSRYQIRSHFPGHLGNLDLDDCVFYNLVSVRRSQDVQHSLFNETILETRTTLLFDDAKIDCNYVSTIAIGTQKRGKFTVGIPDLRGSATLDFSYTLNKLHLTKVTLRNPGELQVFVEGVPDGLQQYLKGEATKLFDNIILNEVTTDLDKEAKAIINV